MNVILLDSMHNNLTALVADTSKRFWVVHWVFVLSTFAGICFLMLGRGHYSIDVLIAYWITTRIWWVATKHCCIYYPNITRDGSFLGTWSTVWPASHPWSNLNHFSQIWWWRLFWWFECNVQPGPLPHGFNLPLPLWVRACVSQMGHCWTKISSLNEFSWLNKNSSRKTSRLDKIV